MSYELFGTFHIFTLVLSVITPFILWLTLRNRKDLTKRIVLLILSLIGVFYLFLEIFRDGNILYDLPIHLCALNGLLIPVVLITKNKTIGNMLLLWSFGALGALIFCFEVEMYTTNDLRSWTYFIPHYFQLTLPITIGILKIIDVDYRTIPKTMLYTFIAYTIVHITNKGFASLDSSLATNYMFSVWHQNNVFLSFFWKLCPYQYFYMLLLFPLTIVFVIIIYFKQFLNLFVNFIKKGLLRN